ncbi:hypothetical protein BGZ63DRAFT_403835 [Mariannaea sp. PMI_226]|nr:hypothetical protein BGZ63DRAFT_403835 [Mariannaea sp. PMI_226]
MALPQYTDEALITLTSINPPSSFPIPDRRFFLTKEKPSIVIGRTSKRNSNYEAAVYNAWFDSPVMSRDHAHLKLDTERQQVYIKDIGSLHGTFKNGKPLSRNVLSHFTTGDTIRFGIPINRGVEVYPPCTLEASVKFGTIDPEDRPKVFRVPDDSDVEDLNSDDDNSIHNSTEILRNAEMRPAQFRSPSPPKSEGEHWRTTEEPESEINLTDSTDMDTESIPEYDSASIASVSVESINDYNLQDDMDNEEDEFEEHDEFVEGDYMSPPDTDIHPQSLIVEDESEPASELPVQRENGNTGNTISQALIPGLEDDMNLDHTTTHKEVEVNAEEALMSMNERQEVPVLKLHEMHNPLLPEADLPKFAKIPPWQRPCFPATLVRLPPLSETVFWTPPVPAPDPKTAAEIMGAKTGKYEFFTARAENRQKATATDIPTGGDSEPVSVSNNVVGEPIQVTVDLTESPMTSFKSAISVNPEESDKPLPTEFTKLADSEWAASGTQFLNSPNIGDGELIQSHLPLLDETSAYQFELSKKASAEASANCTVDEAPESQSESHKATAMEIDNILVSEAPVPVTKEPASTPSKRKASQISELLPEERPIDEGLQTASAQKTTITEITQRLRYLTAQRRYRQALQASSTEEVTATPAPQVLNVTARPPKRLRRAAEMFGIAALGGVAVMSALIATAPSL